MNLIIAEKPSVAKSIALVIGATETRKGYLEGNGWLVSWCYGHLTEAAQPEDYNPSWKKWRLEDLPLLPNPFVFRVSEDTADQFELLKRLMNDPHTNIVINACDAGREGELIFRNVYVLAQCKKPMKRLWISSMEDAAIREGIQTLRNGADYDGLYRSAVCRAEADWLVGINGSRFFTKTYDSKLSVGRVMSPTLALLVQREAEIDNFVSTPFWTVSLHLGSFAAASERMTQQQAALDLAAACNHATATVQIVTQKERAEKAPALYDLTTLQREANRILGYSAQQTLDYLQALYEKKLCSYPRTDSRYLTDDMEASVEKYVAVAGAICGLWPSSTANAKQVCNSKKVSDHHALIPTLSATPNAVEALPLGEREVLKLVSLALLRAVSAPYRFSETVAMVSCAGSSFTAKGKTVLDLGWRTYDRKLEYEEGSEAEKNKESVLPELAEGQSLPVQSVTVKAGKTTPPKHYTEDTLLAAMETAGVKDMPEDAERKGLGTPATRAGILEKLISIGYVEREKSKKLTFLLPATAGKALIAVLPQELRSPQLTAEWEYRLKEIERGELEPDAFRAGIQSMLSSIIANYVPDDATRMLFPSQRSRVSLGTCPRCGKNVIENSKGFVCEDRGCGFAIWKASHFFTKKGLQPDAELITALLTGKPVRLRCHSDEKDKDYFAYVTMKDDREKTEFDVKFPKKRGRR